MRWPCSSAHNGRLQWHNRVTMANISLFIGGIRSLPESGRPTGIYKQAASGLLELGPEGFIGDQQADRRVHGGPDKAVHLYQIGRASCRERVYGLV